MRRLGAHLGRDAVDHRQAGPERIARQPRRDDAVVELARVVEEGQKYMKEGLAVRLAADAAAEEGGDPLDQSIADGVEAGQGARGGEEPLPVAERVRVLRAQGAHRRRAHVSEQQVGPDIGRLLGEIDLRSIVERAASQQHLAALVEAHAPAERSRRAIVGLAVTTVCARLRRVAPGAEDLFLRREHAPHEVGAVSHQPEESCHSFCPTVCSGPGANANARGAIGG